MLRVGDLHVAYGSIVALRGISLNVGAGEIVAVIGPNGAGKSTLLNAVSGAVTVKQGDVEFDGAPTRGLAMEAIVERGVCLVPEGRRIFGTLTVGENLQLGGTTRRDRAAIATDIARVLDYFPVLRERFHSPAGKLSGGEQQQLAIGRALVARPRLMLVDEPSLGLAPMVVDLVYEILARLRDEGLTLLVVEQNARRALAIADRIYVLRTGSIALSGTAAELADSAEFEEAYFGFAGEDAA